MKTSKAFTLIELLIVIVIIGILAVALIPRLTGAQDKARWTAVEQNMKTFRTAIFLAQSNTNKTLAQITGGFGTVHTICRFPGMKISNLLDTNPCIVALKSALRKIEAAAGMEQNSLAGIEKDPRGSPYMLYEFEGNTAFDKCLIKDFIEVVGPDQIYTDDVSGGPSPQGNSDNKKYYIMPSGCPGSY